MNTGVVTCEGCKRKGDSPLEPPKGTEPCQHLVLSSETHLGLLAFRTLR